jgi:hypothetical protein
VGHRLITNPFYTVDVALVQVILTKNYRVLINTLVYNTVIYSLFPWSMQSAYAPININPGGGGARGRSRGGDLTKKKKNGANAHWWGILR